MEKKIITLGEILLRLSPRGNNRLVQAENFEVVYGGSEANVALALSNFGYDTYVVSKVPNNPIGQSAINEFNKFGVNTSFVKKGGDRLGIYYLANGSAVRPSKVVYDRKNSSFSKALPQEFDFDSIMKDAQWFHWCGITPAVSKNAAEITKQACIAAKKNGVTISCDLNYRSTLWTPKEAQETIKPLMKYVDVCFTNEDDALQCLNYHPGFNTKDLSREDFYKKQFKELKDLYGFKTIVSVEPTIYSASHQSWVAMISDENEFYISKEYDFLPIIDGVGGGDAFAAGLIHGLLSKMPLEKAINFAVATGILIYTIPGDSNHISIEEAMTLALGNTTGRIQR